MNSFIDDGRGLSQDLQTHLLDINHIQKELCEAIVNHNLTGKKIQELIERLNIIRKFVFEDDSNSTPDEESKSALCFLSVQLVITTTLLSYLNVYL